DAVGLPQLAAGFVAGEEVQLVAGAGEVGRVGVGGVGVEVADEIHGQQPARLERLGGGSAAGLARRTRRRDLLADWLHSSIGHGGFSPQLLAGECPAAAVSAAGRYVKVGASD